METLTEEEGGGFGVTCPFEPQLATAADTMEEAFEMARDALNALWEARAARLKAQAQASVP